MPSYIGPARDLDLVRRAGDRRRQVTAPCKPRHRRQDFLAFLKQVNPDQKLRMLVDNYAMHETSEVRASLVENTRFRVHFTPTSASWLELVEIWLGNERQALHRADAASVTESNQKSRAFITSGSDRCHAFVWTKSGDPQKAKRSTTSMSGPQITPR